MALKPLANVGQPYGMFDGYDSEYLVIKGGEVVSFTTVSVSGSDLAAKDVFNDGYTNPAGVEKRVVVTKTLVSGMRPLMLADDGIAGYGTLLGSVLGGVAGQVTTGVVIGPSSASGSGKITCWSNAGLYAVSLDAVDTNASTGLVPTNTTTAIVGAALYATTAGLLTPNSGAAFENVVVRKIYRV
jgi:hypothetical protein